MKRVGRGLALVVALMVGMLNSALAQKAFQFALIGDVPYSTREEHLVANVLDDIDRSDVRAVFHVGDIKAGDERCDDDLLMQRKALLDRSKKPLIYVPGDNEWADCARASNGDFDPLERLSRVREMFFPNDSSLGQEKIKVFRQSETTRFRAYRENMRWESNGILFVTFNVPGGNNHYVAGAGRNGEFEERMVANRVWIKRAFEIAKSERIRGVVLVSHANPLFAGNNAFRRDGYREWKTLLLEAARSFTGEILYVHGDTHWFQNDQPLVDNEKQVVKNFTRVEVFGSPFSTSWIRVTADARKKPVFKIEPVRTEPPKEGRISTKGRAG